MIKINDPVNMYQFTYDTWLELLNLGENMHVQYLKRQLLQFISHNKRIFQNSLVAYIRKITCSNNCKLTRKFLKPKLKQRRYIKTYSNAPHDVYEDLKTFSSFSVS